MKTQVWVYVVVAILSLGAGVAIAGVPNSVDREPTIDLPTTTTTVDDSVPATVADDPSPTDAAGSVQGSESSAASVSVLTPDDDTESTSEAATTSPIGSASPTATDTSLPPSPPRGELGVSVVNGAEVAGSATRVSNALEGRGYVDVATSDGSETADFTAIYVAPGFEDAGDELAAEMGVAPDAVRPLGEAPEIGGLGTQPLVVYLGRDVVDLPVFS